MARNKDEPGKGGFWKLDPIYADSLVDGVFKKRRPYHKPGSVSNGDGSMTNGVGGGGGGGDGGGGVEAKDGRFHPNKHKTGGNLYSRITRRVSTKFVYCAIMFVYIVCMFVANSDYHRLFWFSLLISSTN